MSKTNVKKINLLIMSDNETIKSRRMTKKTLVVILSFICILPFIAAVSIWIDIRLWQQNRELIVRIEKLEQEKDVYKAKAERLVNLEKILVKEQTLADSVVSNVIEKTHKEQKVNEEDKEQEQKVSLDGQTITSEITHKNYPDVNNGIVTVDNVSVRFTSTDKLRVGLDVRNIKGGVVAGNVFCTLVTEGDKSYPLSLLPVAAEKFKIAHWKRAVFFSTPPQDVDMSKVELMIEVKNLTNDLLFRNIYNIEK